MDEFKRYLLSKKIVTKKNTVLFKLYRFKGKWTDLRYKIETVLGYNRD